MRRKDDTFLELDYQYLWSEFSDDEFYFLCLSRRDIAILQSGLRYSHWPTRWRINDTWLRDLLLVDKATYQPIWDEIEAYADKLERRLMMDCSEALLTGLQAIATAIGGVQISQSQSQSCGDTSVTIPISNYIQGVTDGGQVIYGQAPLTNGVAEGDYPDGFDTLQDYLTYKCQAANAVFDALVGSMRALASLDIFMLISTGAGAGLVSAALLAGVLVPEIAIPAIIAAMVGIIGLGLSYAHLEDTCDYFDENRSDIVCSFYNSETVQAAVDTVSAYIDEALGALAVSGAEGALIRTIGLILASTDTMDQLFKVGLAVQYPNADCDSCTIEELDVYVRQFYDNAYHDVSFTYLGQGRYQTGSLPDYTVSGVASSVVCLVGINNYPTAKFKVTDISVSPWYAAIGAPSEARAWNSNGMVLDYDSATLADIKSAFGTVGHLQEAQIWTQGGDAVVTWTLEPDA